MSAGVAVALVTAPDNALIDALAEILIDCVAGGASVGFLDPLDRLVARAFWERVAGEAVRGDRALFIARDALGVLGTVQVIPAQPENQPHRADVAKMLVHRRARRRGVGAALLEAAETWARAAGRTILVLDTATGSDAERLYRRAGWQAAGIIPDYALWPDGRRCATTVYWRRLEP